MDTTRAQQALRFQRHSWPDLLAEMRAAVGLRRYPMRLVSPVARQFLKRRAAYGDSPAATRTRGARSGPGWASPDPTPRRPRPSRGRATFSRRRAATVAPSTAARQPGSIRRTGRWRR
jgi:hypothetical protein